MENGQPKKKKIMIQVIPPGAHPGMPVKRPMGPRTPAPARTPVNSEDTSAVQQPRRHYRSDGVKRIGSISDAFRRTAEDDMTLKIKEIKSGDEIRGYVSDWEEYGVEYMDFAHAFFARSDHFVFYEKRSATDGSKSKAGSLSPVKLEGKEDFDELEKCLRYYYDSNPLYEEFKKILLKCADKREIEPIEAYVLIHAGCRDVRCDGWMTKLILRYYLEEDLIGEEEAKKVLDMVLETDTPFKASDIFRDGFLKYESWLLRNYPGKKEIYYDRNTDVKEAVKNDPDEEILIFIEDHLDKDEDSERICALIGCLGSELLLTRPEYEEFASMEQKSVLARNRWEEEERLRKIEEERIRREKERTAVCQVIEDRMIEYFVHFTNAANLENILRYGLLPCRDLTEQGIEHFDTDEERFDLLRNSDSPCPVCLSVSFPNCEMLWRKKHYDEICKDWNWCILLLDPMKVTERKCSYFDHNAATTRIIRGNGLADTVEDFKGMFKSEVTGTNTKFPYVRERIFPQESENEWKYTTSPQAEIQCFEGISTDCIWKAVFEDQSNCDAYKGILKKAGISATVDPWYFGYGPYSNLGTLKKGAEGA